MRNESRTFNSIRNSIFGVISQIAVILLNFIARKVFIVFLNIEYLGLNGLFSNILTILSLAELGVGSAIVYSMYSALVSKDEEKISGLMNLYGVLYKIIGIFIFVVGIALVPFLKYLIKDQPDIENLNLIYILFLANTAVSYFWAYKRSIITADQKDYILSKYKIAFSIGKTITQIIGIIILRNFIAYLLIQIVFTFFENVSVSYKADKMYPFLGINKHVKLKHQERYIIFKNVGALMIYKLSSVFLGGIDNILISSMIGVTAVALYSNYTLVVNSVITMLTIITGALTASVGNFVASETNERKEELLDVLFFANFVLYGFSALCLFTLLNPFIGIFFGENFVFPMSVTLIIAINFYVWGMMTPFWTYRTTMGLFTQGKWRPIISAGINFALSIVFGKWWGVFGIIFATVISRMTTNWWYDPYLIYKKGFGKTSFAFIKNWIKYTSVIVAIGTILYGLQKVINPVYTGEFIFLMFICVIISAGGIIILFHRTKEYKYIKYTVLNVLKNSR